MASLKPAPELGPHQRVVPTREDGKANSEASPLFVQPTSGAALTADVRADTQTQILVELRVISQLIAIGLNVNDDTDAMRNDEFARLGL